MMKSTLASMVLGLVSFTVLLPSVHPAAALNALPLAPRMDDHIALAPRSSDLKPRYKLKQVTRQQLLERHAKKSLMKARAAPAPPAQSPIPPTTGECSLL